MQIQNELLKSQDLSDSDIDDENIEDDSAKNRNPIQNNIEVPIQNRLQFFIDVSDSETNHKNSGVPDEDFDENIEGLGDIKMV